MVVIAARPSMGKTALAMNIAEYVAINEKLPVGVFSLEMTSESLVLRMLCSRSRVNLRNVRQENHPEIDRRSRQAGELPFIYRRFLGTFDSAIARQSAAHVSAIWNQAFRR
jgi:replicative DNA helicase